MSRDSRKRPYREHQGTGVRPLPGRSPALESAEKRRKADSERQKSAGLPRKAASREKGRLGATSLAASASTPALPRKAMPHKKRRVPGNSVVGGLMLGWRS